MTVIKFFSSDPLENVASLVTLNPSRVLFLCDQPLETTVKQRYERLLKMLDQDTVLEFRAWCTDDGNEVERTLRSLLEDDETACVDLTGGNEIALMGMGRVAEQLCKTRPVAMHRFDIAAGKARRVPSGDELPLKRPLCLTIEQFMMLHSGEAADSPNGQALREWQQTPSLRKAVTAVWNTYAQDPERWNGELKDLLQCVKYRQQSGDPLEVTLDMKALSRAVTNWQKKLGRAWELLNRLQQNKAVCEVSEHSFRYASNEVKQCLAREGNVLELYTLTTAMQAVNDHGDPLFFDAKCGVYIDWSGNFGEIDNVHNEIDVMLMSGVRPVFISCKNGEVPPDEVYVLRSIADRFGGKRAIAVLIANEPLSKALEERAKQMNIQLFSYVYRLSAEEFEKKLKALV